MNAGSLAGLRVLDFSMLVPGPLATLFLAEAGADVVKIEPPGGEMMRHHAPRFGSSSAIFALLNRGKRAVEADLKRESERTKVRQLATTCDVLLEQFRPGVMHRFGLGYDDLVGENPGLVFCSLTGYGQVGPNAGDAGHDLNYLAATGILGITAQPQLPPVLIGDIGGGSYPCLVNILMALMARTHTGRGQYIDIAVSQGMQMYAFAAIAEAQATGVWPRPGQGLAVGGTARYGLYETKDGQIIAATPLEDKFWASFCGALGLSVDALAELSDVEIRTVVSSTIVSRTAQEWMPLVGGADNCCTLVRSTSAVANELTRDHGSGMPVVKVHDADRTMHALPLPVSAALLQAQDARDSPDLMSVADASWL